MQTHSESVLIEGLRNKDQIVIKSLTEKAFPCIKLYFLKKGLEVSLIKEIFSEGLRILIKNIENNKFEHKSNVLTYLFGICKKVMLQKLEMIEIVEAKKRIIENHISKQSTSYNLLPSTDKEYFFQKFREIVKKAGVKCDDIFELTFNGYSQIEIAEILNTSQSYIAKRKCECLEKIKELVKENKDIYNFFQNYQEWLITQD
jgi:RNA polymerase sigma factor (sigma-70 family)